MQEPGLNAENVEDGFEAAERTFETFAPFLDEEGGVEPDDATLELESRLGTSLLAARGNETIRQRLGEIVRDRERFGAILRTFGPSHAHVLDLLAIARHVRAKHGELPRLGAQALAIRHLRTLLPNQS